MDGGRTPVDPAIDNRRRPAGGHGVSGRRTRLENLVSGVVGVTYILLGAVATSLGRGEIVPAVAAAWGPIALFAAVTSFYGLRIWRRM